MNKLRLIFSMGCYCLLISPSLVFTITNGEHGFKIGMLLSILFGALGAILGALVFKWIKPYIKK